MKQWHQWAGPVALVLACGVSVALAAAIIVIALNPGGNYDELEAILTTLAGAAVGAVGAFLGASAERRHGNDAEQPPE